MTHPRHALTGLAACVFSLAICLSPAAWSVDLTVRENTYTMTPVSQLQEKYSPDDMIFPVNYSDDGSMGVDAIKSMQYIPTQTAAMENPVSVSPIAPPEKTPTATPTFVVFPVMVHASHDKAFADLPITLSTAVANQLLEKCQREGLGYSVLNPLYAYDELKEKGLDGLYDKMVRDYMQAGQPNEKDLTYLADQLSSKTRQVTWVVFVQADFDMNQLSKPAGFQIPLQALLDQTPQEPNYFLSGKVQIFGTTAGIPLVWGKSGSSALKMSAFGNYTKSIYDDSDSALTFKTATDKLAKSMVSTLPPTATATHSTVQATLVPGYNEAPANITPEDQETLKRILQQN
jgi:hypothetical protein